MFSKIRNYWDKFEAWLDEKIPRIKVKLVALTGIAYPAAIAVQSYVQGLPLDQMITPKTLLLLNVGLFTMVFWLRNIGDRVEARAEAKAEEA